MAIAFDAHTTFKETTGTSLTFSHTCTGSNLVLWVNVLIQSGTDLVTGVTYNGVAMTRAGTPAVQGTQTDYGYYLYNPATGSNSVVVSTSSSVQIDAHSTSFTGVDSGHTPAYNTGGGASGTQLSVSVTTTVDNSWLVGGSRNNFGPTSGGTNTTWRETATSFGMSDSNGALSPAGSYSQTWIWGTNAANLGWVADIAPPVAATVSAVSTGSLLLMGVGN